MDGLGACYIMHKIVERNAVVGGIDASPIHTAELETQSRVGPWVAFRMVACSAASRIWKRMLPVCFRHVVFALESIAKLLPYMLNPHLDAALHAVKCERAYWES